MSGDWILRRTRAGPELDAELLRFTSSTGTGNGLQIALDRSPSFFEALDVEGECADVVVTLVEDEGRERVVGAGAMTEKKVYLNGSADAVWVGQLSSARIDPALRGGLTLARSFRLLREWHRGRRARVYLTTVLETADMARRSFESGKGAIPVYRDRGRLLTSTLPVGRRAVRTTLRGATAAVRIARAGLEDAGEVIRFWRAHGPRRQFFPAYSQEHLLAGDGLLRGLALEDLLLARALPDDRIVGTMGLWDQGAFRRWRVVRLPAGLSIAAPLWNGFARLAGRPRLPRRGEAVSQSIAAAVCVVDDDPGVFLALLQEAVRTIAREGGDWLTLGLHEADPLLPPVRRLRPRELVSRLYLVHWPEDREFADAIDPERCPYLELGAL